MSAHDYAKRRLDEGATPEQVILDLCDAITRVEVLADELDNDYYGSQSSWQFDEAIDNVTRTQHRELCGLEPEHLGFCQQTEDVDLTGGDS